MATHDSDKECQKDFFKDIFPELVGLEFINSQDGPVPANLGNTVHFCCWRNLGNWKRLPELYVDEVVI